MIRQSQIMNKEWQSALIIKILIFSKTYLSTSVRINAKVSRIKASMSTLLFLCLKLFLETHGWLVAAAEVGCRLGLQLVLVRESELGGWMSIWVRLVLLVEATVALVEAARALLLPEEVPLVLRRSSFGSSVVPFCRHRHEPMVAVRCSFAAGSPVWGSWEISTLLLPRRLATPTVTFITDQSCWSHGTNSE